MIDVARLLLAAVFMVAGAAKLFDLEGSRKAARGFGMPAWLGIAVPVVEIGIALALLPEATVRAAAVAGAALLAVFTVVVANALVHGRKPDCGCLGKLHSAPAGWGTVARNVALAALALAVASRPAGALSWVEVAVAGVAIVVAAQAVLAYTVLRRYGRALARIEQLESGVERPKPLAVGEEAPSFDGLPARGRQALLVFTAPNCGPCAALLPKIAAWQQELANVVAITTVDDPSVSDVYGVEMTPSAVLIDADGRIAGELTLGADAVEGLLRSLEPKLAPTQNGSGRVATAAALAGGLAVTAAANAGIASRGTHDPELNAIDAALRAAGPKLVAASVKSRAAVQAQATLKTGKAVRAKRKAAVQALVAERRQVLALRARIEQLPGAGTSAHNVKASINVGLTLLAQSLQKQERALGARSKSARVLLTESERLFVRSLGSFSAAATLMDGEH